MSEKPKTYRVQEIPPHFERHDLRKLLRRILSLDRKTTGITIFSLASSVESNSPTPTKVATVRFTQRPSKLKSNRVTWSFSSREAGLLHGIIIDTHFLGFTVPNDVPSDRHDADCIAISGLASHPFGSWKVRDDDSDFMWIRDAIPSARPRLRCILYGYDTHLQKSKSFKNTEDIALTLTAQLRSIGCTSPSAKPTVFLAHSLGGVILKEAFVQMARSNDCDLLSKVRAVLLFGVPNRGMQISHLVPMVKGQPNKLLVERLAHRSPYLLELDSKFNGVSFHRSMRVISIYETKESPIPKEVKPGIWERGDTFEVLVNKQSAIHSHSKSSDIFSIEKDHSNLVKFAEGEPDLKVVISYLHPSDHVDPPVSLEADQGCPDEASLIRDYDSTIFEKIRIQEPQAWHDIVKCFQQMFFLIETFERFGSIEAAHVHTYGWIFQPEATTLRKWLGDRSSTFYWINGKPGSGKSTAMKYIFSARDKYRSPSKNLRIDAHFFFFQRGSRMQKSFYGLLRCVLYQILKKSDAISDSLLLSELSMSHMKLTENLQADVSNCKYHINQHEWTTGELERLVFQALEQCIQRVDLTLFLDGLHEFDGDPEKIVFFLLECRRRSRDSLTSLKICFASRPWNIFQDNFHDTPQFRVEDHTSADMERYVKGRLHNNKASSRLILRSDARTRRAIYDVLDRVLDQTDGVFLWLRLVLDIILNELAEGTAPQDLSTDIEILPGELEELYVALIGRIKQKMPS